MKLSNEESMIDLEEWDSEGDGPFTKSESESFSFFLLKSSLKTLEDEDNVKFNVVRLHEEEVMRLDPVFKVDNDLLVGIDSDSRASLR